MLFQAIWLLSASICGTIWLTESHVRFVCPRPVSVQSNISFSNQTLGYCGEDIDGQFDKEYTEVIPGLFTVRFEETQFHRNSPYRVSLHSWDSDEYCVLLDHIPHNNHALFSSKCEEKGNDYPLGVCNNSNYYITVNIPDMTCDRCYFRLTYILLDSSEKIPCELSKGTCSGYVSCANIKIRASSEGQGRNISSCSRYEDNLAGNWPFRPQDQYRVEVIVREEVEVEPLMVYDPMHMTLRMDIPGHTCQREMKEVQVRMNTNVLWNITVEEEDRQGDTVVVEWTDMDSDSVHMLKEGELVFGFKCEEQWFEGNISFQMQNFSEGKYQEREKAQYSPEGWLADYRFKGPQAEDLTVRSPAGPCAPSSRNFIAFLHLQDSSKFVHGILVASIMGNYADITVALYNIKDDITAIIIRGSELLGAPDVIIPLPEKMTDILQVSLDFSRQIPFIGTVQFLKRVEVKTTRPDGGISGSFEEGMYTLLRQGRDIKGIGAFQFTKGQWLKYEILVTELESHMHHMELQGDVGVVYNLSHSIGHLNTGFCLVEGLVQDLSSKLLLQLWEGRLRLVGYTNTSIMQGMVTSPGAVYCKEARDTACYFIEILPDGEAQAEKEGTMSPFGQAVFLLEGAELLQYSIDVHDVKEHARILDVSVRDGDALLFAIKMMPDPHHGATYTATGHLQVSADLQQKLLAGGLKLEVFPRSIQPTALRGYLPPVRDHLCLQPKYISQTRVVGDHRGYWSIDAAPFQPMFAMIGDSLEFKYAGNISLFAFSSKEDYNSCNFSNASQIGPEANSETQVIYTMHLDHEQSLYFGSQQQCNDTPPLKLTVTVGPAVPPTVGDSVDNCGLLVFSDWRRKKLDDYSGPDPAGPVVAGLILGILVALAFYFWDRRLQHKAEIAVPGSRFQRF